MREGRQLVEARLRDDAIREDYGDDGIGTQVFEFVKERGYRVVRLERIVDRASASVFICEFENDNRERRFKMSIRIEDNGRFDIKLDSLGDGTTRKLLGERQHALEILKVYV